MPGFVCGVQASCIACDGCGAGRCRRHEARHEVRQMCFGVSSPAVIWNICVLLPLFLRVPGNFDAANQFIIVTIDIWHET